MSWSFSPALAAEFSAALSSDTDQSAPSRSTPIAAMSCSSARTMERCQSSPSGMTSAHSTGDPGLDSWISSQAGSRARTSAAPAEELASTASGLASGRSSSGWFARFDHDTGLWKTPQCSLLAGLDVLSVTWPRSGINSRGMSWALITSAPRISAIGSGFLPTVTARDARPECTPRRRQGGSPLRETVMWPTPNKSDASKQRLLAYQQRQVRHGKHSLVHNPSQLRIAVQHRGSPYGHLNPEWIEWLMGWPAGWTEFEPWATGRYLQYMRWRGAFCSGG